MCTRTQFVGQHNFPISERYVLRQRVLGEGGCGQVVKATHVHTKKIVAIKAMCKKKMELKNEHPTMERDIMKTIDHPNIVKLIETFDAESDFKMVLEMCSGGPISKHVFSGETQIASVMFQIFYAVRYLHKHNILHMDINASNILLESSLPLDRNNIKIADFGSARRGFDGSQDILCCAYVMRFLLSSGPLAQYAQGQQDVSEQNITVLDSRGAQVMVSADAKNLLGRLMLAPRQRPTAGKVLGHRWFTFRQPRRGKSAAKNLITSVVERLIAFSRCNKLKRAVLHIMADHAPVEEIRHIRSLFASLDRDFDGLLLPRDLRKALVETCGKAPSNLSEMMRSLDSEGVGVLEFTAFAAALIDKRFYQEESACRDAFDTIDADGDGLLSPEEIAHFLCNASVNGAMTPADLAKLLREDVDQNGDGAISFSEFRAMVLEQGGASGNWHTAKKQAIQNLSKSASTLERSQILKVKQTALARWRQKQDAKEQERQERKKMRDSEEKEKRKKKEKKERKLRESKVLTKTTPSPNTLGRVQAVKGEWKDASRPIMPAWAMKTADTTMAVASENIDYDIANLDDLEDTFDVEDLDEEAEEEDDDVDHEDDGYDEVFESDEDDFGYLMLRKEQMVDLPEGEEDFEQADLPPFQPPVAARITLLRG
eukprot:TRINITY_DN5609_c0_g1_i2.p1 TRINITY_DN5609_c0_g1~~TRINITY_DN5609_c0_g1_i2.p1  ORF type:complete len:656 (-),score=123.17 TRINITY_DN5609_c0_g1_i2:74-2041(-)